MKKIFVISFDEAIIFERYVDVNTKFYNETYESFNDAKKDLVAYWDNYLHKAKKTLKEVKKMKHKDVKTFE